MSTHADQEIEAHIRQGQQHIKNEEADAAEQAFLRAVELLVRTYQNDVMHFCSFRVGRQNAEDVAQNTFVGAYRSIAKFRFASSLSTWHKGIASRQCYQHFKNKYSTSWENITDDMSNEKDQRLNPDEEYAKKERLKKFYQCLEQLKPQDRDIFCYVGFDGMPYRDIADSLNIKESTIRKRFQRAKDKIEACIAKAM